MKTGILRNDISDNFTIFVISKTTKEEKESA